MAYTFDQIFAADPANPSNVAQNASITIFAPGDTSMTPLTITDPDGQPLTNPLTVNANGFGSAFAHETLDRVAWAGGSFTGFFTSYDGMKEVAVAAQVAAESAASTAAAEAAAVATVAIGDATADAEAAAASAATSAAAASTSATAATNAAALVGAPADPIIAAAVSGTGETKAALNAAYAPVTGSVNYAPATVGGKVPVRKDELTINVVDYGADPTGVTDSRAAIQSAIDFLRNGGKSGGEVFFPIGDYMVSNTINIKTGVKLKGAGMGGHWMYPTMGRARIFILPGVDAPVIKNSGAGASYDDAMALETLYIEGPTVGTNPAVIFQGKTSDLSQSTERGIITGCYITNKVGTGLQLWFCQTFEVRNNYISGCLGNGIDLKNSNDNLIDGNQIDTYKQSDDTLGGDGITLNGVSSHNIITGNFFFLCNRGLFINSGYGNVVSGNRFNTCNYGVLLQSAGTDPKQVSQNAFTGNAFYDHGYKAGGFSILVDGYSSQNTFTGNTMTDEKVGGARTALVGIRTTTNTTGNIFAGNVASNHVNVNFDFAAGSNTAYGNNDGTFTGLNLPDGQNLRIGSTTGSVIGQSTSKLGFYGATPIVKPTGIPAAATDAATTQALANYLRTTFITLGMAGS